jgi:hypothetical protein
LEAAIILSVLLALIEQIVKPDEHYSPASKDQLSIETPRLPRLDEHLNQSSPLELESLAGTPSDNLKTSQDAFRVKIIKRMRIQVGCRLPHLSFSLSTSLSKPPLS